MTDKNEQEAVMVRYLLRQSPDEERTQVEERFFSDGEYFDQLVALEDSLIDDYVSGRMPAEQLGPFKETLAGRKDDIRFSGALAYALTKRKPKRLVPESNRRLKASSPPPLRPRRSFALAASVTALLVLVALSATLYFTNRSLQSRLIKTEALFDVARKENEGAQQELSQARSQNASAERELETERNKRIDAETSLQEHPTQQSPNAALDSRTIVLAASLGFRGAASAPVEVRLSANIRWLRFVASVKGDGDYDSYRISIKLGQRQVYESGLLQPTGASRRLAVTVPVENLAPGDYILTVFGQRGDAPPANLQDYYLRIRG